LRRRNHYSARERSNLQKLTPISLSDANIKRSHLTIVSDEG